jgi:hypothetical protein
MALTAVDWQLFSSLREAGVLPPKPAVLELGEAEWYGDVEPEALEREIARLADTARRARMEQALSDALRSDSPQRSWDLAKIFYALFLDFRSLAAIDFHGTPAAMRIDLNLPVTLKERYDVVINGGTAEHVFNVFQFFRTCHELTRAGGLMLHSSPFRGWLEHGFYNFNPTFFWDLAQANGYEVVSMLYTEIDPAKVVLLPAREKIVDMARAGELGANAMLYAVYRKPGDREFVIPAQGFYAQAVSEKMARAWFELR